jgi:hypothetical protein
MSEPMTVARLDQARRDLRLQADDRLVRLDIGSLLDGPVPRIDWVWDGYFEAGTICQLHGDGGVGKSILAAALVRAAVGGHPFLGRETFPIRAVVIDGENPTNEIHRRLERLDYRPVAERVRYWQAEEAIFTDLTTAETLLCEHLTSGVPADLLVLDSQRALWYGEENEASAVRPFYAMQRRVVNQTGAAILNLHHDNRGGKYSGSSDLNAAVDSRLHLTREEDGTITLTHEKLRSDVAQRPLRYRLGLEDGRYTFQLLEAGELPRAAVTAAELIRTNGRMRTGQLADAVGVHPKMVQRWASDGVLRQLGIDSDRHGWHLPTPGHGLVQDTPKVQVEPLNHAGLHLDTDNLDNGYVHPPQTRMVEPKTAGGQGGLPTGEHLAGVPHPSETGLRDTSGNAARARTES